MTHPLVDQLRFARREFRRGLEGITDDEAGHRILPMNCISWNIGHLAAQEQRYWLGLAQDGMIRPDIDTTFRSGSPASCPPLADVWRAWEEITAAADPWLDQVTGAIVATSVTLPGRDAEVTYGSMMLRAIYHYWYHNGENAAIRQQLGHAGLPVFVGTLDLEAPYRAESQSR